MSLTSMNMSTVDIQSAADILENYFHLLSAFFLVGMFGIYLWFVLVAGPEFMKNREPFNVVDLIRLYNVVQVVACSIYVVRAHQLGFTFHYLFKCEKFESISELVRLEVKLGYWLFLGLRTFEFVETVFFVLRKKHKQASFLHIFHHIGSVLMTWLFIVSDAELMAVYIALINSCVHIMMYTYYFFSSFKYESIQAVTGRIKPLITIIQLIQFGIIITHCIIAILPSCGCGYFFHLQIVNFIVLTILFSHFFIQTYIKKSNKETKNSYEMTQS